MYTWTLIKMEEGGHKRIERKFDCDSNDTINSTNCFSLASVRFDTSHMKITIAISFTTFREVIRINGVAAMVYFSQLCPLHYGHMLHLWCEMYCECDFWIFHRYNNMKALSFLIMNAMHVCKSQIILSYSRAGKRASWLQFSVFARKRWMLNSTHTCTRLFRPFIYLRKRIHKHIRKCRQWQK